MDGKTHRIMAPLPMGVPDTPEVRAWLDAWVKRPVDLGLERASVTCAVDYRRLLILYINAVGEAEGVDFIGKERHQGMTEEEFAELQACAAEELPADFVALREAETAEYIRLHPLRYPEGMDATAWAAHLEQQSAARAKADADLPAQIDAADAERFKQWKADNAAKAERDRLARGGQ